MDEAFVNELKDFMAWTRKTLQCVKESVHKVERHCDRQNGSIQLIMERERATHDCASKAHELATANSRQLAVHQATAELLHATGDERDEDTRSEVKWLKDNIWKLALGGVSALTLGKLALDILERLVP